MKEITSMTGPLKILRIEIDGHFHGSADVPKPWVAEITGVHLQFGLDRTFLEPMNDWSGARRACSGNLYGRVAHFALREGRLYEISRLRGKSSKRYVAREFGIVVDNELRTLSEVDAIALAERHTGPAIPHTVDEGTRISRVEGVGTPVPCGFVLRDGRRTFRLRIGALHEIATAMAHRLVIIEADGLKTISQAEGLAHLAAACAMLQEEPLP
jgi:hypothetical protein